MNAQFAKHAMGLPMPGLTRLPRIARKRLSLAAGLTATLHFLAAWRQRRAVVEELNSLSDHELADIGITRADVPFVFDPAFAAQRGTFGQASF